MRRASLAGASLTVLDTMLNHSPQQRALASQILTSLRADLQGGDFARGPRTLISTQPPPSQSSVPASAVRHADRRRVRFRSVDEVRVMEEGMDSG